MRKFVELGFGNAETGIPSFLQYAPDPLLLLVVPAVLEVVPDVRQGVSEHLRTFGIAAAGPIELAVSEAVANAALHAYPGDEPGRLRSSLSSTNTG